MKRPDTSRASQRAAILNYLRKYGTLTTIHAREELGIMHPGGRVFELRQQGYNIITHRTSTIDGAGTKHREAKYVLFGHAIKKAQTTSDQTNGKGIANSNMDNNRSSAIRQSSSDM